MVRVIDKLMIDAREMLLEAKHFYLNFFLKETFLCLSSILYILKNEPKCGAPMEITR